MIHLHFPLDYTGRRDPSVTVIKFAFPLPGTGDNKYFIIMIINQMYVRTATHRPTVTLLQAYLVGESVS